MFVANGYSSGGGQFVRVLGWDKGELIPLTLADWDADKGTIDLVVQDLGSSSAYINARRVAAAGSTRRGCWRSRVHRRR